MIEIDKDVELPAKNTGPKGCWKYPWREMEVGDSFFAPGLTNRSGLTAKIPKDLKGAGCKFASRGVDGGLRIWRIK